VSASVQIFLVIGRSSTFEVSIESLAILLL
jgi:hypothetical protein